MFPKTDTQRNTVWNAQKSNSMILGYICRLVLCLAQLKVISKCDIKNLKEG